MKHVPGAAALLLLATSCMHRQADTAGPPSDAGTGVGEIRDIPLGPNAAEPPWWDLIRHTNLPGPERATHPGPSRDGRLLAYATTEFGPRPQIAVRETMGAAATQITHNQGDNLFPRISPDGKLIAYCSNRDGNWDLFVARLNAPASVTQVTFDEDEDVAPSWSPDGKRLAYCSRGRAGVWRLVLVEVGSRLKTYLGPGLYPDWSPDPKDPWICFQSQPRAAGGRSGIGVVRPDGTQLRDVVGDKFGGWSAINPRFSSDGRWIVYATVRKSPESRALGASDEADDVWIIRPDGTLDTRLTDDLSAEWWPCWGGDRVFFVSTRDGAQNIYSVRPRPLEDEK